MKSQDELKKEVALAALDCVRPHFDRLAVIGVGTGSTADYFIDALAPYAQQIKGAVASSQRTADRLSQYGIALIDLNDVDQLPVYVDGADEINDQLHMIKGGGGALTREKIVAAVARQFICVADASKYVATLGQFPLPVEVIPMARTYVSNALVRLGGRPVLREGFVTDNGNVILDVHGLRIADPLAIESQINQWAGVVTVGLFAARCADVLLLGTQEGVKIIYKSAA